MAGPANAIMGDDFGTDIPETNIPDNQLLDEKKMAKFTRTAEYARQKRWIDEKVKYYKQFTPDGRPIASVDPNNLATHWVVANEIISVLEEFRTSYEEAAEIVKEVEGK